MIIQSIWNNTKLSLLCNGSFYVEKDSEVVYEDYAGKDELLNKLQELIWHRYFDFNKEKVKSDNPIFYESTTATQVYLIDFNKNSSSYNILVFTEDGYLYDASIKYLAYNKEYQFIENYLMCYKLNDVLSYNKDSNNDEKLSDFIEYYNFAMNHIICKIDSDSLR